MIKRMLADTEISEETLMGEVAERVGIGGNFLGEMETRRRIRAGEHFMPTIGSRLSYDAWKAEGRTEMDVAREQAEAALARHVAREPYLSDDQLSALRLICGIDGPQ
jgi:trimethylamine:corrinoid methyltransferase-like protein